MEDLEREIRERLPALTPSQLRQVLNVIRPMTGEGVQGTPGYDRARFAGIWTKEEADEIERAIEEQCERVQPYGT